MSSCDVYMSGLWAEICIPFQCVCVCVLLQFQTQLIATTDAVATMLSALWSLHSDEDHSIVTEIVSFIVIKCDGN